MQKLIFREKITLFFSVVVFIANTCSGQDFIGRTEVKSITRNQYGGGAQNWGIAKDNNNRLYIANNEGLLLFDGTNWQLFPVSNKTILRSIGFSKNGKLFAGAQDEFGYYAANVAGQLGFISLKNLLPAGEKNFTDVWELEVAGDDVFFRTNAKIFQLSGEKITTYPSSSSWVSMHRHQEEILAQDAKDGLLIFKKGSWEKFIPAEALPKSMVITDIVSYKKDTSIISTISHGLFLLVQNKLLPLNLSSASFNSFQHITSLSVINDSSFLIGTYFNGVYHITRSGKVIENITTKNGLPNNTVRFVFSDHNGNTWAGLDNGLAFFSCNNAIRHINPPAFNNGAGYNCIALNSDLYFALSTGLYSVPVVSDADISSITTRPQTIIEGLTWNLSKINDKLYAGRDDGFWKINNRQAIPVSQEIGYWGAQPVPNTSPLQIAAGNYTGINKFTEAGEKFFSSGSVEKFSESSRYLETDNNNIWVSHPYRGVYKINIQTNTVSLYNQQKGLPADLDNHVFKIKNKIVFATTAGIYEYDAVANKMIAAKEYADIVGPRPLRYLKEDVDGNIWFVQDKMVGVADYSGAKPVIHYIPELKNKILSGFENIFPFNSENILAGSESGFYHINYKRYRESIKPIAAYLTLVKIMGRSGVILFGGHSSPTDSNEKTLTIPYWHNSLHFEYTASLINLHTHLEFSYYLKGFDDAWSNWSTLAEKDYTNLPSGSYTLHIKARNSPSNESEAYIYSFTIKPPWHQTLWAYALYVLLFGIIMFVIFRFQARKHKRRQEAVKKQLTYQHQLELEKTEKELIRLKNEKLEAAIEHKNAELASATMNLVQKKEFILKLKTELQQLQKRTKVGEDNPELKKLIKVLSEEEKSDEEWNIFSQHFDSVFGDFITILKNKFPSLKPHELRLCAYLRMNLNSKEIAPLMSISLRGVEISRYRLRKKLDLTSDVNLVQFLMDLK